MNISRMTACVVGAGVVLACSQASASADPGGPLIETACSYRQIVAALRVEAPIVADLLDDNPAAQARLQNLLALPIEQRRQRLQQKLDENPQWRTRIEEHRNTAAGQDVIARVQRIADTCSDY